MPAAKPPFPSLQRGHPLAQGVVGDWPFYEGSGLTANDVSGQGNHGTLSGQQSWAGGQSGWAIHSTNPAFDSGISFGSGLNIGTAAGLTLAVTFRTTTTTGVSGLAGKSFSGSKTGRYAVWLNDSVSGEISCLYQPSGGTVFATKTASGANDGNWHTAVAVFDRVAASATLYLDGKQVATASGSDGLGSLSTTDLFVTHAYNGSGVTLAGDIDSVVLYSRALSRDEVAALYADPFARHRRRSWRLKATTTVPSQVLVDLEHSPGFQPIVAM